VVLPPYLIGELIIGLFVTVPEPGGAFLCIHDSILACCCSKSGGICLDCCARVFAFDFCFLFHKNQTKIPTAIMMVGIKTPSNIGS
jgi:hypothetical protein